MLPLNPAVPGIVSPVDGRQDDAMLVYGAGSNQVPVIQACRRAGWRVIAVDRDADSPGAELADRFVCLSLRDHEGIVAALADEELAGVVARITDHVGLESSRRLARDRGLSTPCPDLFSASTSKVALAAHCKRAGLPTPTRYPVAGPIPFEKGPVIVRPDITIYGKAGIHRVASAEAMQTLLPEARSNSGSREVDISAWVPGVDVSVLAHLAGGQSHRLAFWDEWVAIDEQSGIRGVGCGMPSVYARDAKTIRVIDALLEKLAGAFPASKTLIVLSLRIDSAGAPWIIEIHLGIGGDGIADQLLPAVHPGFDPFQLLARIAAGESVDEIVGRCRPHGLLRSATGWRLIEAKSGEALRAEALTSLPKNWEPPAALIGRFES